MFRRKEEKKEEELEIQEVVQNYEPKYSLPARTDLVHLANDEGADSFVYRKLEIDQQGRWNVINVEIYDVTKILKKSVKPLEKLGAKTPEIETTDENIVVKTETLGENVTYLSGLRMLAQLQRMATDRNGNYQFATPEDVTKILKISDKKLVEEGLLADEFANLKHFMDVCDLEELPVTIHDQPLPLPKGRPVYEGVTPLANMARVKKLAKQAPVEDNNSELSKFFNDLIIPNKYDLKLIALEAADERNEIMAHVHRVAEAYIALLESPADASLMGELRDKINDCQYVCDQTHKLKKQFVRDDKELLLKIKLSANVVCLKALDEKVMGDISNFSEYKARITGMRQENFEIMSKLGISKATIAAQDSDGGAKNAPVLISQEYLKEYFEDYNKVMLEFQKKLSSNPEVAAEQRKVLGSKALHNRR